MSNTKKTASFTDLYQAFESTLARFQHIADVQAGDDSTQIETDSTSRRWLKAWCEEADLAMKGITEPLVAGLRKRLEDEIASTELSRANQEAKFNAAQEKLNNDRDEFREWKIAEETRVAGQFADLANKSQAFEKEADERLTSLAEQGNALEEDQRLLAEEKQALGRDFDERLAALDNERNAKLSLEVQRLQDLSASKEEEKREAAEEHAKLKADSEAKIAAMIASLESQASTLATVHSRADQEVQRHASYNEALQKQNDDLKAREEGMIEAGQSLDKVISDAKQCLQQTSDLWRDMSADRSNENLVLDAVNKSLDEVHKQVMSAPWVNQTVGELSNKMDSDKRINSLESTLESRITSAATNVITSLKNGFTSVEDHVRVNRASLNDLKTAQVKDLGGLVTRLDRLQDIADDCQLMNRRHEESLNLVRQEHQANLDAAQLRLESTEAQLQEAQAQLAEAQAQLTEAQAQLAKPDQPEPRDKRHRSVVLDASSPWQQVLDDAMSRIRGLHVTSRDGSIELSINLLSDLSESCNNFRKLDFATTHIQEGPCGWRCFDWGVSTGLWDRYGTDLMVEECPHHSEGDCLQVAVIEADGEIMSIFRYTTPEEVREA
ncbi:hypothetical protein LIA77_10839 [Sarocladium implicatum]|nr:hypothetical protein LIA77_10839 [Sarocladium implicatum]